MEIAVKHSHCDSVLLCESIILTNNCGKLIFFGHIKIK